MTFTELTALRVAVGTRLEKLLSRPNLEPVVQCATSSHQAHGEHDSGGVVYQRCGGGRRVIRKRIGSV